MSRSVEFGDNLSLLPPQDVSGLVPKEQREYAIAEFVARPSSSLNSLYSLVNSCTTEAQQQVVVGETLTTLIDSLGNQEITKRQFDSRILRVLEVDQTVDTQGDRAYRLIKQTISRLMFSEDDEQARRGIRLCRAISVNTMEKHLGRMDVLVCTPKRMGAYIRNIAFQISRAEAGTVPGRRALEESELLATLVGITLDRAEDSEEDGFANNVLGYILNRDNSEAIIETLKVHGGDEAMSLLDISWPHGERLDHNMDDIKIDEQLYYD